MISRVRNINIKEMIEVLREIEDDYKLVEVVLDTTNQTVTLNPIGEDRDIRLPDKLTDDDIDKLY